MIQNITVVHCLPSWLPLTQTWLYNQVKYLPDGVENHVVCERTENLDQFPIQNIHSLNEKPRWLYYWERGFRKPRRWLYSWFLVKTIRQTNANIVHSHYGFTGWASIGAIRKTRAKHIVTYYGLDVNRLPKVDPRWNKRYLKLFENVDKILCEGPHMAQCTVKLGCVEEKVKVHHLGVSVDDIPFRPRIWKSGEPLKILIAGSFREKKGIPYALEALGRFQHQKSIQITIIGDATPGFLITQEEKQKIFEVLEKHKLKGKTRMLGYQPHSVLFEEAYKHHVFLSPSITASDGDTEGGAPVSIIEMLASGMPVVSTTHCDIPNVIINGETGLLTKERDVDGIVTCLCWLVEHPEMWYKMVKTGRRHIEKEFNALIQGVRLYEIYNKLK